MNAIKMLFVGIIAAGLSISGLALAQNVPCFKAQGGSSWEAGSGCTFDGAGQADVFVLDDDGDTTISSPTDDQIDIEISGADDFRFTANTLDALSGSKFAIGGTTIDATAVELNEYVLTTCIADISTAQSDWIIAPHAGDISKIYSVIDGAIASADAVLTFEIGGTLVTNGTITVANSGSGAGDIDSSTPSAANAVTAGQAIEVITSGASTNAVEVCISMTIAR